MGEHLNLEEATLMAFLRVLAARTTDLSRGLDIITYAHTDLYPALAKAHCLRLAITSVGGSYRPGGSTK
jgi:hypothetical protein